MVEGWSVRAVGRRVTKVISWPSQEFCVIFGHYLCIWVVGVGLDGLDIINWGLWNNICTILYFYL
jgi:hypothetical protein